MKNRFSKEEIFYLKRYEEGKIKPEVLIEISLIMEPAVEGLGVLIGNVEDNIEEVFLDKDINNPFIVTHGLSQTSLHILLTKDPFENI